MLFIWVCKLFAVLASNLFVLFTYWKLTFPPFTSSGDNPFINNSKVKKLLYIEYKEPFLYGFSHSYVKLYIIIINY